MNLSKSRYTQGITCSKKLWLSCYKQEEAVDTGTDAVLANGTKVGELARYLFGDYKLVEFTTDFQKMLDDTNKYLLDKPNVICEASFSYDNNFCSVDILKNDIDGVEIYEVKSSAKLNNIYIDDITYQTWVLKKLGYNVKKACIVYINNKYTKNGELDLKQLFNIKDVTDSLDLDIDDKVKELKEVINHNKEPDTDLSIGCDKPYSCPYFNYCTKNLSKPNVFDIGWRMPFKSKLELYRDGKISFEDVFDSSLLNDKAKEQVESYINNSKPKIKNINIKRLLDKIKYPLYFLDFESFQEAIPTIDGTRPYQQICFQYSLHYYLEEGGELYHKEYLSDNYDGDPMHGLCEQLIKDIPMDSCVTAYHKSFECTRLKEMAKIYPEFRDHLLNISNNIIDLEIPFANQDYYVKDMAGRSSIKVVLPALFPNDPKLDYHNLDQVHKGDEASDAYLSLKELSKEEENKLRYNMLKYCELDTYAMVKIYEKLKKYK